MLDRSEIVKDNIKAKQNTPEAVEKIYEVTLLLDFYGQLLTERQYAIMNDYYNNDLSLGEIAENLGISRQGVYDSTRKAKQALAGYEIKLGLVERFTQQEKTIEQVLNKLKQIRKRNPDNDSDFKAAVELLTKVLDTL